MAPELLNEIVCATGLNPNTCIHLVNDGWTFEKRLNEPSFLQSPSGATKIRLNDKGVSVRV